MATHKEMKQLMGVITRGEGEDKRTFWTKIGVAYRNKDDSYNLRFEYLPTDLANTTIQLRDFKEKE
jgi:hypothetical protein